MKLYLILFFCLSSISCASVGTIDLEKKTMTLSGFGARKFSWKADGVEANIEKDTVFKVPDIRIKE